ncbi:MAG TPA: hypothetical protein VMX38_03945 [Verrucomicrobiae bacterium]|jgi:hypothetical protein|nr:hypothetical protein [Verrucomicrobiae bacterium]
MSNDIKHSGNGGYERKDIGVAGVVYFLIGLAIAAVIIHFVIAGLYNYLDKRFQAEQPPVSPLTNAPKDTRKLPANYADYLKQNFPSPQLEIDERTQLNSILLQQEQTLATYGYVDEKAGIVRIPIERAMQIIAQRGLPVRPQGNTEQARNTNTGNTRGTKQ